MESPETLKRVLAEWESWVPPSLYPRNFDEKLLEGPEILSIIGARRSGKTSLCYQIIKGLKGKNPSPNILYINLEDERLHPLQGNELTVLWECYLEMFPVDFNRRIFVFIDEVQNVKNWSQWARRITEQHRSLKLVVTGSSSRLLSREIATELRGRTLSFTVYPLSFDEYLRAHQVDYDTKNLLYDSPRRSVIKRHFNRYFKDGGFPGALQSGRPQELLKEYYRVMYYRDLVDRFKIKNLRLLEDYLTLLMDQTGCLFSISATAEKLKSFGHALSKNTLGNFSRYAEDIFLMFGVKKYSRRIREQLRAPTKVYAIDHGLVQAVRFSFSEDYGRLLENIVFIALQRMGNKIYYHLQERECDFLRVENQTVIQALQVCRRLSDPKTREREIQGLTEALDLHRLKEGLILTEDETETVKIGRKTIQIVPVWYWLLTPDLF